MRRPLALVAAVLLLIAPLRTERASAADDTVVWYATVNGPLLNRLAAAFMAAHPGITVETLQLSSSALPARVLVETQNGAGPDVIVTDEVPFMQLAGAGVIARYDVRERAAFVRGAVDPNGLWAAAWIDTTVIAFNPARLHADGLPVPRSLDDFTQPAWKGKFALYTGGINWFLGIMQTRRDADAFFAKLAKNAPLISTSHAASVTQLADGEADATPAAYGYYVEAEKRRGAPVDFVAPAPVFVTPNPVGLVKNARHPAAARLLIDWLLSKAGQQFIVAETGHVSARSDVANDPAVWDPKAAHVFVEIPPPDVLQADITRVRTALP